MRSCGFELLTERETRNLGLPYSYGSFRSLYNKMVDIYSRDPNANKLYEEAYQMSSEEQFVSFLNMYFVFKKVRDVDLSNFTINIDDEEYKIPEEIILESKPIVESKTLVEPIKPISKKEVKLINESGIIKKYDMTIVLENVTKKSAAPKTVKFKKTTSKKTIKKVVPVTEVSSSDEEEET